jgi:hypothetical protein
LNKLVRCKRFAELFPDVNDVSAEDAHLSRA